MKIKILTNFIDYYDREFDNINENCIIWDRRNIPNFTKIEQFTLLNQLSYKTPLIGSYNFLKNWLNPNSLVMVYLNDKSHNSKDKIVITLNEFKSYNENTIASEFIIKDPKHEKCCYKGFNSTSYRNLILNDKIYGLTYHSNHEYFSNYNTEIIERNFDNTDIVWAKTLFPLFSVDGVYGKNFKNETDTYWVDFNTAPELKNTVIDKLLNPKEIYKNVKEWYAKNSS